MAPQDLTPTRYWFRRRGRGYRTGVLNLPASWEGWAAYAVHIVVVVAAAALAPTSVSIAVLVLATVALIVVVARFGEPPPRLPSEE